MKLLKSLLTFNRKYPDPVLNTKCSEFEVNNWIISKFVINELIPVTGITPYPINELFLMVSAVCRFKPTHIFEWGTHFGKSARIFYETAKNFGIHAEIHSIDLPDEIDHIEHPQNKRGKYVKGIKEVTLHQGDGLDKSLEILKSVSGEIKPLFFLDGDHSYESVKRELSTIIEMIPAAIILIHDTFYQSSDSGYNTGPYRAIEDALAAIPDKYLRIDTSMGLPGMTLLYQL